MNKLIGKERTFSKAFEGRGDIVRWEVLKIEHEQDLKLEFISSNSEFMQGVRIAIDVGEGYIEIEGDKSRQFRLWENPEHKVINIKCSSDSGLLSIYNVWDAGSGCASQSHTSGMIIENIEDKIIFRCNDFGYQTNFDKLIFQITLI